jgi:glycosyltransferase involved in cell wall biosynthesis
VAGRPDIALVSLGTTMGLRLADEALASQLRAAGATCEVLPVAIGAAGALRRSMALTDVVEGLAARRAAAGAQAGAVIYSSVTAALLQPARERTAVRFDGIAAANRPGPGGAWQRRRERTVLAGADLLLPWSDPADDAARELLGEAAPASVVLPPPVSAAARAASGAPEVLAYAANPDKRRLDLLCAAWAAARPAAGTRLGIGGLDREEGLRWLAKLGGAEPEGVEWLGSVDHERWLGLIAGARAFLNASRHEDWGLAQMEALAAGTPLVTVEAPGANAALPLARELEPRLVAGDASAGPLGAALRVALDLDSSERERYRERAAGALAPYREEALAERVEREVLPLLLEPSSS